ncbi:MAG: 3'(2'),5'-bisphosphate nucleotidase CysQ, partial [Corynebacterium casei]
TYIPDLVICRPELADEILEHAAKFAANNPGF